MTMALNTAAQESETFVIDLSVLERAGLFNGPFFSANAGKEVFN